MIIKRSNEGLRVRQREQGMTLIELMMAMVVLAALVVLEATPIGPLLYPVF